MSQTSGGLYFLLQQIRIWPTSLPDLRGKGHKCISRTSSGKNHRITVDTSKSWTWQLWQRPFGPCRLLCHLSRTKCPHHHVSVKCGNRLALLLRLKTSVKSAASSERVQTIRLFHLTSIIPLLKATDRVLMSFTSNLLNKGWGKHLQTWRKVLLVSH